MNRQYCTATTASLNRQHCPTAPRTHPAVNTDDAITHAYWHYFQPYFRYLLEQNRIDFLKLLLLLTTCIYLFDMTRHIDYLDPLRSSILPISMDINNNHNSIEHLINNEPLIRLTST